MCEATYLSASRTRALLSTGQTFTVHLLPFYTGSAHILAMQSPLKDQSCAKTEMTLPT